MSAKKYRIEYIDRDGRVHLFIDDKPYNFVVYNPSDGFMVNARELNYGQRGWLMPDEFGCEFTIARVMEIDDRIWLLRTNQEYWNYVLYYRNQEIWHDDTYGELEYIIDWIIRKQPDVPQEQIDLWRNQTMGLLADKHLAAIHTLYGTDYDTH